MAEDENVEWENLEEDKAASASESGDGDVSETAVAEAGGAGEAVPDGGHTAAELEAVFDIPVRVSAVLGKCNLQVSQLMKLGRGAVIELDRKVGEAIDVYVNNRLVARGEVVLVEDRLGVTMTEIIKGEQ